MKRFYYTKVFLMKICNKKISADTVKKLHSFWKIKNDANQICKLVPH